MYPSANYRATTSTVQVPIPRSGSGVGAPRIRDLELVRMVAGLVLALNGKPQDDVDITNVGGTGGDERQATSEMTVVLVDPRRPSLIPVEAIELLAGDVQYTEEMPVKVPWSLPSARPAYEGEDAPVLLSSDPDHPAVQTRLAAGDKLIAAPDPQGGERLVDAVAMMDKLRTAGPWESEQTHDSLRRFLLEETYELFDAVRSGNADELREELGDVSAAGVVSRPHRRGRARSIRSPSTTSPTRCCASSPTACPRCLPVNRFRWMNSWRNGKSARPREEREVVRFDGRRADGPTRVGVGAEGD